MQKTRATRRNLEGGQINKLSNYTKKLRRGKRLSEIAIDPDVLLLDRMPISDSRTGILLQWLFLSVRLNKTKQ